MTAVPDKKSIMQIEETKFDAAVSESVLTRMAGVTNFIVNRILTLHDFNLNGKYNIFTPPFEYNDGFLTFPFPFEIVDVVVSTGPSNGSSGTTEIDVKWRPDSGGAFASIFSTTPKFTNAAAVSTAIRVGQTKTGFTAPVLSKSQFDAYDYLKMDVLQVQAGSVDSLYVKIFVRPLDPP